MVGHGRLGVRASEALGDVVGREALWRAQASEALVMWQGVGAWVCGQVGRWVIWQGVGCFACVRASGTLVMWQCFECVECTGQILYSDGYRKNQLM